MGRVGRRIYADKTSGAVLADTGEPIVYSPLGRPSIESDFEAFYVLQGRDPESVIILELEPGQYAEDFAQADGYRVNPETLTLEFSYRDPNNPETPPVPTPPLTAQVAELKAETAALNLAIIDVWETLAGGGV
ncbi:hypothetical protein [Brevibacillus reuszeri]|uniref:hypothetical protein n=1 Tax=Brevibacillus reuszeri TaxID=54915 RepID=UPI0019139695|nr:hypothetical protein [Brevibacillus reuszeri]